MLNYKTDDLTFLYLILNRDSWSIKAESVTAWEVSSKIYTHITNKLGARLSGFYILFSC